MNVLYLCVILLFVSSTAYAQPLNCAAFTKSASAVPDGYVQQCMHDQAIASTTPIPWLTPQDITSIGFALDVGGQAGQPTRLPNSLYTFTIGSFGTQSLVGTTQEKLYALDFSPDGTTLYGATRSSAVPNPSALGTVDKSTGAFTLIGPLTGLTSGDSATGLTIDPLNGAAYFSAAGGTPSSSRLYSVDLASGALSLIGPITAPTDGTGTIFIDIAVNCEGQLFGHNINDNALYSIDPGTGTGTFIGTHGFDTNYAQGMDFDNSDGTLYAFMTLRDTTNRFGSFNLSTGGFTTLVTNNPPGEYEGAIPTTCPNDVIFANGFD